MDAPVVAAAQSASVRGDVAANVAGHVRLVAAAAAEGAPAGRVPRSCR